MTPPDGLAPKAPPSWARWLYLGMLTGGVDPARFAWTRDRMLVLSSLIQADFHGQPRWQWLVTVSARAASGQRRRPTDDELRRPLRDFGMERAEEDNHMPGVHRGFFLICDAKADDPVACECKETEETVTEPDGFRWQKDRDVDADQKRAEMEALQFAARNRR